MIGRIVLDYATSARNAIELLHRYNIYSPANIKEECHFMICDKDATYVVEFINNKMNVLSDQTDEFDDIPNAAIMTNFYLSGWDGEIKSKAINGSYTDEEIIATGLTPHGAGYERYNLIKAGLGDVADEDDMFNLMKSVQYTKMYDETTSPFWYSEYVGPTEHYGDFTYLTPAEDFAPIIAIAKNNMKRERGKTVTELGRLFIPRYMISQKRR